MLIHYRPSLLAANTQYTWDLPPAVRLKSAGQSQDASPQVAVSLHPYVGSQALNCSALPLSAFLYAQRSLFRPRRSVQGHHNIYPLQRSGESIARCCHRNDSEGGYLSEVVGQRMNSQHSGRQKSIGYALGIIAVNALHRPQKRVMVIP